MTSTHTDTSKMSFAFYPGTLIYPALGLASEAGRG